MLAALVIVLVIIVGIASGYSVYVWQQHTTRDLNRQVSSLEQQLAAQQGGQAPQPTVYTSSKGVRVTVYSPARNAVVASPAAVIGEVPGSWSFEASFPIELRDANGSVVSQAQARVLGDWMTGQPVPFSAQLTFTAAPHGHGSLVLKKDNPSGLSANDDAVTIPINF